MEYLFKGTLKLSGVQFFIEAANEEEAKAKAAAGRWNSYEVAAAEATDCNLILGSCEENE